MAAGAPPVLSTQVILSDSVMASSFEFRRLKGTVLRYLDAEQVRVCIENRTDRPTRRQVWTRCVKFTAKFFSDGVG